MPVLIKVSQNKNDKTAAFGKWYGRVVSTKTMSYQELCKHMSEHNSIYGEDVCLGVANKLQNCMLEQLLEGKKVQFGELGTFYLSVKSSGADKEEDWLYRITYSPKDKVSNSEEITVSFHRDYIQIGSEFYLAKQGVDYDDVLEWAKSKHEYLVKEYGAE